jgi:hypothetical protein
VIPGYVRGISRNQPAVYPAPSGTIDPTKEPFLPSVKARISGLQNIGQHEAEGGAQGRRRPLWLTRRVAKSGWRASPTQARRAAQVPSLRPGREEAVRSSGPQTYHQSGVTRQTSRRPASVCKGAGPRRAQAALKRACSSCSAARRASSGSETSVGRRPFLAMRPLYQKDLSQGVW